MKRTRLSRAPSSAARPAATTCAQLFRTCTLFRDDLSRSEQVCQTLGFPSFVGLIARADADLSQEAPIRCQLALVALQMALAHVLESWGMRPSAVVGHSLGEYSALGVAGALSRADVFFLVGERARAMQRCCRQGAYAMLAVGMDSASLERYLHTTGVDECEMACLNSPTQTVVSGPSDQIRILESMLPASAKVRVLSTPFAFHSKQLDAILPAVDELAEQVQVRAPRVIISSSCWGRVCCGADFAGGYFRRQTREPVLFQKAIESLAGEFDGGAVTWLEVGPAPLCLPMVMACLATDNVLAALDPTGSDQQSMARVLATLYEQGSNPRWDDYHWEHRDALLLLQLPSYPFDMTSHWINYRGDWQITKHQGSAAMAGEHNMLESATLHRLESDTVEKGTRTVRFSSRWDRPELRQLAARLRREGEAVDAGIYVDMTLAAARYVWGDLQLSSMHIAGLECTDGGEWEPSHAVDLCVEQRSADESRLQVCISSNGVEGARCSVERMLIEKCASQADKTAYLFESRMEHLERQATHGALTRYPREAIYAGQPATFPTPLDEAVVDGNELEGTARFTPTSSAPSPNMIHPAWLGGILRLPRFVLDISRPRPLPVSYRCRGWDRLHIVRHKATSAMHRVHARIHPTSEPMEEYTADMHVLDAAGKVMATMENMHFQVIDACRVPEASGEEDDVAVRGADLCPTMGVSSPRSTESATSEPATQSSTPATDVPPGEDDFRTVLDVIAAEMDVNPQSITDDQLLDQLGMDSLMQISIAVKLREVLPYAIPPTIITECNRVSQLRDFFEAGKTTFAD